MYQCYIMKDCQVTIQLIQRAFKSDLRHIVWRTMKNDKRLESTYNSKAYLAWDHNSAILLDSTVTCDDIR